MTPRQSSTLIVSLAVVFGGLALAAQDYDRAVAIFGSLIAGYVGGESVWRGRDQ